MIYHVCLQTAEQVRAQGLGVTNFIMYFVEAETYEKAETKIITYLKLKYNVDAKVSSIITALRQRRSNYAFPDSVI